MIKIKERRVVINREHFVEANKYLNIVGAATILDMLSFEDIEKMVLKHLVKIFGIYETVIYM